MKPNALLIDSRDNVVTALRKVPSGGSVVWAEHCRVEADEAIPAGHKIAIEPIAAGTVIRKYGHPIGMAGEAIAVGDHVHTHNLNALENS